jgi:enamine deaminase RidA (YjgF/YER057c/UK114 family)
MALVNKWSDAMNTVLGEFLAREGIAVCGAVTRELPVHTFLNVNQLAFPGMLVEIDIIAMVPAT